MNPSWMNIVDPSLNDDCDSEQVFDEKYPNTRSGCTALHADTKEFIVRRGQEVLALQPRQVNSIFFTKLSSAQESQYEANLTIEDGKKHTKSHLATAQRICNISESITGDSTAAEILLQSTKSQFLFEVIKYFKNLSDTTGLPTKKVVICSHFTDKFLDKFEIILREFKFGFVKIAGDGSKSIASVVTNFEQNPFINIMLLSTTKGGCGLTLVSSQFIFLVDLDWSPMNDKQAMARVYRMGQELPSFVYMLVSHGKFEDSLFQVQEGKNICASLALGDENELIQCEPGVGGRIQMRNTYVQPIQQV
jgi:SNF2 family DNA or RNA helicase